MILVGREIPQMKKSLQNRSRAPRDPIGRRKAIINAVADLIMEEGISKVTNRRVTVYAGVPLSSTTQYFKSIGDLRYAGLEELALRVDSEYRAIFAETDVKTDRIPTDNPEVFSMSSFVRRCLYGKSQNLDPGYH